MGGSSGKPSYNVIDFIMKSLTPFICGAMQLRKLNDASDAKACFLSKVEYRAGIRYLYLKDKTGKEIHSELANVYGASTPSYAQVKFWVDEIQTPINA